MAHTFTTIKNKFGNSLVFIISMLLAVHLPAEELKSPNGTFTLQFEIRNGTPSYQLFYRDKMVVDWSKMGLELQNTESLITGFTIAELRKQRYDGTWQPVWGEEKEIRNHYEELEASLHQQSTDRRMIIRFRLFNDGLG
ncbi:MAG: glycoside hydrolase family 97 protein, partial [Saprospiraceae bacterium]|nr:glycoside hydrolase family 97 protein [Saprospiraceae bacterium]